MAWPDGKAPEGKKWKKGESGNPGGRPSKLPKLGKALGVRLKDRLESNDGFLYEAIITKLIQKARKGDLKAAEMVLAYGIGKPAQTLNVNSNDGPKLGDINERLAELVGRAAKRATPQQDDGGGEAATDGAAGDAGKPDRVQ